MRIRGRIVDKPYISQNDCAVILAITKHGKVLMIRSYRPELDGYAYEIPSGTLKKGESAGDAARRELREETGYVAKRIKYMFSGYPLLGYSDCNMHFFLATGLEKDKQIVENDESIFIKAFDRLEVRAR